MANLKPRKRGRTAVHSVPERAEEHTVQHASPASLVELPLEAVRRYRLRYRLPIAAPATFSGFLLGGPVGRLSSAHAKHRRSSYRAAQQAVTDHLNGGIVKEGDAIAEFLYTMQHKDEVFKLRFGHDDRAASAAASADAEADAVATRVVSTELSSQPPQPQQPQAESHIPLPVEPLSARTQRTAEFAAVTARG